MNIGSVGQKEIGGRISGQERTHSVEVDRNGGIAGGKIENVDVRDEFVSGIVVMKSPLIMALNADNSIADVYAHAESQSHSPAITNDRHSDTQYIDRQQSSPSVCRKPCFCTEIATMD